MMENSEDLSKEVSRYSVVVGFILIVVFVVPCVLFALLAKFFQTPDGIRRRSVRNTQYTMCLCNVYFLHANFNKQKINRTVH